MKNLSCKGASYSWVPLNWLHNKINLYASFTKTHNQFVYISV